MNYILDGRTYAHSLESPREFWESLRSGPETTAESIERLLKLRDDTMVKRVYANDLPNSLEAAPVPQGSTAPQMTKFCVAMGRPVINPVFIDDGTMRCGCDLLEPAGGGAVRLIDLTASTKVTPQHEARLAFACWGAEKLGLRVASLEVVHVDSTPHPNDVTRASQWLRRVDVTEQVMGRVPHVESEVARTISMASSEVPPPISDAELARLSKERAMELFPALQTPDSPLHLFRMPRERAIELLKGGQTMHTIPEDELTPVQARQRAARLAGGIGDHGAMGTFLNRIKFPAVFYDFETISSAIPVFEGVRPHQHVPFLFSAVRVESPGAPWVETTTMVHPSDPDPTRTILESLAPVMEGAASTVAYSSAFEHGVLSRSAERLTEHADWVRGAIDNNVDLYEPFRSGLFYRDAQEGRTSLKKTSTAVLGADPYADLEVRNGLEAMVAFFNAIEEHNRGVDPLPNLEAARKYVGVDALVMLQMVEQLEIEVHGSSRFTPVPGRSTEMSRDVPMAVTLGDSPARIPEGVDGLEAERNRVS